MDNNLNQNVSCIANYAYEASEPDELSIKPGDVLRDVERLSGGWWRGELRGRRGMFPDNFVSVVTEHGNTRSSGVQGRCRAVFSYQPANPDELALCVGDVLDVLAEVEEGWWQGRRQGRVGVFPSNFVVMLDPPQTVPPFEPAPALPPKPVKELCRVLFPYTAMNEDELSLTEGDIVTLVSKDAPDRGWWKGELLGRVGLFPDNFVELLPPVTHDSEREEKKPERPPSKTNVIYPILNKYSEKTASVKELTTSRISLHKENTVSKENSTHSTVTHTSKNESEKIVLTETVTDSTDGQVKKPPVPLKKSPTPTSGVGSLLSGLKNKIMSSSDKDKEKQAPLSHSGSSSSGEWDRPDGLAASKPSSNTNTLDHVERNSILQDPRAGRVKAPRRRPPSQVFRDDTPMTLGLSNGHEVPADKPIEKEKQKEIDKTEEIKPRAREWEKHRAPWMAELKLNQAKKTSFGPDGKSRSQSSSSEGGVASKTGSGSTDRILDCGLEEKRSSTHSMEMSKSTSSITTKMAVVENLVESFEETKVRQSLDSKDTNRLSDPPVPASKPLVQSPTAAGRTISTMLDEVRKPIAPSPPSASVRTSADFSDKSPNKFRISADFSDKSPNKSVMSSEKSEINSFTKTSSSGVVEKSTTEKLEKTELKGTLDRIRNDTSDKNDGVEALITQLSNRILNLEKLLEVQNAKFNAAIEDLTKKLNAETEKRLALQSEMEKLAHCVTQV